MNWREFEDFSRKKMSDHFQASLHERKCPDVPKRFDFVSDDGSIVGDAKYLTLVRGKNPPPAKFMEICGHVWFLERTNSAKRFLVFGNQREVPEMWLKKYGDLVKTVQFFFLSESGDLERLN